MWDKVLISGGLKSFRWWQVSACVLAGFANFNFFINAIIKKQKAWFGVLTADFQFLSFLPVLIAVKVAVLQFCADKGFGCANLSEGIMSKTFPMQEKKILC